MARQVPQDRREFVRISVDLATHEKILNTEDPPLAGWLYVVGVLTAGSSLSDGEIVPRAVVRKAGVAPEVAKWLIAEDAWHEPGHRCPRCAQPREGRVMIHDYLQHNRSRAQAEAAQRAGRQAAAARWGSADGMPTASAPHTDPDTHPDTHPHSDVDSGPHPGRSQPDPPDADRMPTACDSHAEPNAEVEVEREVQTPLLTFVGRLAGSDARTREAACPPAEVIAAWQRIAGPDVDLEAEAAAYLAKQGGRPARDEAAAWVGWLNRARRRAAQQRGVKPPGCRKCIAGWLPDPDDPGFPSTTPCPACKPHTQDS